jgi:hypothetical protein
MDLKILDEFNFIKSKTDVSNDYLLIAITLNMIKKISYH